MPTGNWTCSGCGGSITELPFEPRSEAGLKCKACFAASKGGDRPQRQKFQGDWKCSGCGAAITELPFQPNDESKLTCYDCYKASRG